MVNLQLQGMDGYKHGGQRSKDTQPWFVKDRNFLNYRFLCPLFISAKFISLKKRWTSWVPIRVRVPVRLYKQNPASHWLALRATSIISTPPLPCRFTPSRSHFSSIFAVRTGNAYTAALRKGSVVGMSLCSRESTFWRLTIASHGRVLA